MMTATTADVQRGARMHPVGKGTLLTLGANAEILDSWIPLFVSTAKARPRIETRS